ncbi:pyridoxamine 5'-phosphate oxidase family protein [Tetragenococcus solitarius]|uniref:Pyridoxamine 5'-phosphate oxidase N-terminal domain-containing protein n=1 Tax=Tetragenococcus solitarius TaxID=71453 RepID=A0ABN3XYR9_9ENTE|nr:pyridoxamine 5'-phosphate oxidase family protein [Tetragenococcus solitarius]
MEIQDIMKILEKDMKVAVFSTVDENGQPHARHINIGVASEEGVFFMTSPKTNFYQQLQANPKVAITGFLEEEYLIQVIRIEGKVRKLGKEKLQEVLADNPYIDQVYPDEADRQSVQVFQLYTGEGFYQSLTQGHKYTFTINA